MLSPSSIAHETHTIEGEVNVIYNVTFSNNATNYWYDYSTGLAPTFHVNNETQLTLTIANVSDTQSEMDLSIGNATFLDSPDWEVEEALAIGFYKVPATFGFVANNSWTTTKFAMDQLMLDSFNFSLPHLQYLGGEVDSVVFEFQGDSQITRLIYDQSSGILLEAASTIFGYNLEFKIHSINGDQNFHKLDETSESTDDTTIFNSILISTAFFVLVIKRKY